MKYKNEAMFSKSLIDRLTAAGFNITRIESHGTMRGIPDMFVQGHGFDVWLELKNGNSNWRPGQFGWCYRYYLEHNKKKCVLTLRSMDEGIAFYPMTDVAKLDCILIEYKDLRPKILTIVLKLLTHIEKQTLRELCILAGHLFDVDYDPDAYWEQEQLEQQASQFDRFTVIRNCIELRKNEP